MSEEILEKIIISENAYFYKKKDKSNFDIKLIRKSFREMLGKKHGIELLRIEEEKLTVKRRVISFSCLVYKYKHQPTFIDEEIQNWFEVKMAYIFIVSVGDYVVISRKNISGIDILIEGLNQIDYKIITGLFVDDKTAFEKFSLKNTIPNNKGLKHKTLEADDLKDNFSILGASSFALNGTRLKNGSEKMAISFSSSRINKFSDKNGLHQFFEWCVNTVAKIEKYVVKDNYLSIFAEPVDYETEYKKLVPAGILFLSQKINDSYENSEISAVQIVDEDTGEFEDFPLLKLFEEIKELQRVEETTSAGKILYRVANAQYDDIFIQIDERGIKLKSSFLRSIKIEYENGASESLLSHLNSNSEYLIAFSKSEYIYTNRKLFKDHKLINSLDSFLGIFVGHNELRTVPSEKGEFKNTSITFSDSVFKFVEDKFMSSQSYMVCDDLGNELSDHLGLADNSISVFHSKYSDTQFSASAFHDIIAQAQKNLGNICPSDGQIDQKSTIWDSFYNADHARTRIPRIRKGDNIGNLIAYYKKQKLSLKLKKNLHLVINFISIADLNSKIQRLKANDNNFDGKHELIQIIWLISGLIAACRELNTDVTIHCKP